MKTALLVIAHGSRNVEANNDLHHMVGELRQRGVYAVVEPAFLELTEPTIQEGGRRCVEQGATRVILLPFFLSPGVHARQDLQEYRQRLGEEFSAVEFTLAEPLGKHPLLIEILLERAEERL